MAKDKGDKMQIWSFYEKKFQSPIFVLSQADGGGGGSAGFSGTI